LVNHFPVGKTINGDIVALYLNTIRNKAGKRARLSILHRIYMVILSVLLLFSFSRRRSFLVGGFTTGCGTVEMPVLRLRQAFWLDADVCLYQFALLLARFLNLFLF
jgi:hypothetical protein